MSSAPAVTPFVPVGGLLTPRAERLIRTASVASATLIAACAMVLSYAGLHDLAIDAGVHPRLALLVPIMVDGLQFVGSLGVVYSTLSGLRTWYPWILMLMGVSISAWGNWQAAPEDLTARLLHAASPVILALVLEELLRVMRHKVQMHAAAHLAAQVAEREEQERAAEAAEAAASAADDGAEAAVEAAPPVVPVPTASGPVEAEPTMPLMVSAPVATSPVREAIPLSLVEQVSPVVEQSTPSVAPVVPTPSVAPTTPAPVPASVPVSVSAPAPAGPVAAPAEDLDEDTLPPYPEGDNVTFRDQVTAILAVDPEIKAAKIARVMGKDPSTTRKMVKSVREAMEAETAEGTGAAAPGAQTGPAVADPVAPARPAVASLREVDPFAVQKPHYREQETLDLAISR